MADDEVRPQTWTNSQQIIAFAVVGTFIGVILIWLFHPPQSLDQAALGIINMLIGVLVAKFTTVVDYTFGSSAESKNKGDSQSRTIDRLTSSLTGTGPGVVAAAKAAAAEVAPAAAAVAAPAAAAMAAPPAADVAAPPAAEVAVAEAFAKRDEDHPGGNKDGFSR
jgi:hypothetical protein